MKYTSKARAVHAKAPLRLGLAGGGTDVAPYCDIYGGCVLNATISLFTHCHLEVIDGPTVFTAADFDETIVWLGFKALDEQDGLVLHRAVYQHIANAYLDGAAPSLRVTTYSDAPLGSGVGASSSLVVAMVQAYVEMFQLPLSDYDIARLAFQIERVDCGMAGGKQDQYAAAFGGFNFMEFGSADRVIVNPLRMKAELSFELESRLLLYFTGRSRASATIIEAQIDATKSKDSVGLQAMHDIKAASLQMKEKLLLGQVSAALEVLGSSWAAKKLAAPGISNSHIDKIATAAMDAGATGLKISGAGGGGFMMIAADAPKRYEVVRALEVLGGQFFSFCFVNQGVQSWKIS